MSGSTLLHGICVLLPGWDSQNTDVLLNWFFSKVSSHLSVAVWLFFSSSISFFLLFVAYLSQFVWRWPFLLLPLQLRPCCFLCSNYVLWYIPEFCCNSGKTGVSATSISISCAGGFWWELHPTEGGLGGALEKWRALLVTSLLAPCSDIFHSNFVKLEEKSIVRAKTGVKHISPFSLWALWQSSEYQLGFCPWVVMFKER